VGALVQRWSSASPPAGIVAAPGRLRRRTVPLRRTVRRLPCTAMLHRYRPSARSSGAPRSCFTAQSLPTKPHSLRLPNACAFTDGILLGKSGRGEPTRHSFASSVQGPSPASCLSTSSFAVCSCRYGRDGGHVLDRRGRGEADLWSVSRAITSCDLLRPPLLIRGEPRVH
jgi:hypothetical protein